MGEDIRWKQRLQNYTAALKTLKSAVELAEQRELSNLEKQGLIQSFEFTHELAWNLLKDYFQYQGNMQITGSRDAAREAFQKGLISQGDIWMEMIKSRNQTAHTYNESTANEISKKICNQYAIQFISLEKTMQDLAKK
jgi:nucleotidyltransferase substrate binding protein (TIGR01987 family)